MAWFRKWKFQQRTERRIEFLGEQDGDVERELKSRLISVLAGFSVVQRAYLVRVGFQPDAAPSVALCLVSEQHDPAIVEKVRRQFASLFAADVFLDMLFLDPSAEADVARVCSPFYERLYDKS